MCVSAQYVLVLLPVRNLRFFVPLITRLYYTHHIWLTYAHQLRESWRKFSFLTKKTQIASNLPEITRFLPLLLISTWFYRHALIYPLFLNFYPLELFVIFIELAGDNGFIIKRTLSKSFARISIDMHKVKINNSTIRKQNLQSEKL